MRAARRAGALLALASLLPCAARAGGEAPVEEDYVLHCSACHGPDGAGVPGVVPGLGGVGALLERPGGRAYLVRVPGAAQSPLDDARLARLLGWVARELGGAELRPPLTASEVGAARRTPLRDPAAARRALLSGPVPPPSEAR